MLSGSYFEVAFYIDDLQMRMIDKLAKEALYQPYQRYLQHFYSRFLLGMRNSLERQVQGLVDLTNIHPLVRHVCFVRSQQMYHPSTKGKLAHFGSYMEVDVAAVVTVRCGCKFSGEADIVPVCILTAAAADNHLHTFAAAAVVVVAVEDAAL